MSGERRHLRLGRGRRPDLAALGASCPRSGAARSSAPASTNWRLVTENDRPQSDLTGLPDPFAAELAWMAHWQALDGTRVLGAGDQPVGQHPAAGDAGKATPSRRRSGRWTGRPRGVAGLVLRPPQGPTAMPRRRRPAAGRVRLRPARADRPLPRRAVVAAGRVAPALRSADTADGSGTGGQLRLLTRPDHQRRGCGRRSKWHLGTQLEAGHSALDHGQPGTDAQPAPVRQVADHLPSTTPARSSATRSRGRQQAAAFAPVDGRPPNRVIRESDTRHLGKPVTPADSTTTCARWPSCSSSSPPTRPTPAPSSAPGPGNRSPTHTPPAGSARHPHPAQRTLNDANYVDDHALAQITAALPLARAAARRADDHHPRRRHHHHRSGLDDPQAMRMILLQILTGRRASEIRTCDFDCLSARQYHRRRADDAHGASGSATPKARSTSRPTPSSSTTRSPRSSRNNSVGSPSSSRATAAASCSSGASATAAATSPTRQAPTTGCCATSATSSRSPTARAGRCGSATPTASGTPS